MSADTLERMPALYLSHGAPPLADDPIWPGELAAWSADLPRPKAILMVSAHWEEAPLALGAVRTVPLVYDFWGFPEHYYKVTYGAPGAPELADSVRKLLRAPGIPVQDIPDRGLDHGAYVPLVEMFPDVDSLLDFRHKAPAGRDAHPRTEHFAPLFVTMGAADVSGELDAQKSVIDGFWMGMAKRSVQFG